MDDKCLYKFCYSCSDNERLHVTQGYDRLHSIMKAREIPGDNIHSDLQIQLESDPTYQGIYNKSCVTKYNYKGSAEKQKRAISSPSRLHEKRM